MPIECFCREPVRVWSSLFRKAKHLTARAPRISTTARLSIFARAGFPCSTECGRNGADGTLLFDTRIPAAAGKFGDRQDVSYLASTFPQRLKPESFGGAFRHG